MDLQQDFQDGCNKITQALAAKGSRPANNSPEAIANAIGNITSKALVFTSSPVNMSMYTNDWKQLTTDDFVAGGTVLHIYGQQGSNTATINNQFNIIDVSYNQNTGILSFGSKKLMNLWYGMSSEAYFQMDSVLCVYKGTVGGK